MIQLVTYPLLFISMSFPNQAFHVPGHVQSGTRDRYTYMKSELIPLKSQETSKRIQNLAKRHHFQFLNSRKHLMKAASNIPVHGPKDWTHFNEAGYKTLSKAIICFIREVGNGHTIDGILPLVLTAILITT